LRSTIVGAYREMPGLTLTLAQAARLFGLRDNTCRVVMEDLVREGRLRRTSGNQYAKS
jgi:DNA-binding IclR family transcriptional regulator